MTGFQSKRQMAQERTSVTKEVLKLALDALEASHFLIHGNETKGGLVFCMDGYYSGCFDIDSNDKQTNEAITAIREALAQPVQGHHAAIKTLEHLKYTYHGGQYWKPPLGKVRILAQPEERNFCPRCGKRTADIHTCTPPMENT